MTKGVNREGPLRALNNHVFEHLNPKPYTVIHSKPNTIHSDTL